MGIAFLIYGIGMIVIFTLCFMCSYYGCASIMKSMRYSLIASVFWPITLTLIAVWVSRNYLDEDEYEDGEYED